MGGARILAAGRARGGASLAFAILCAFVLTLAQTLTLAHASSHEASGPGHDTKTCVYHVNGDRPSAALAPEAPEVGEPVFASLVRTVDLDACAPVERAGAFSARGPPLQA
jgi:hypothetical protein